VFAVSDSGRLSSGDDRVERQPFVTVRVADQTELVVQHHRGAPVGRERFAARRIAKYAVPPTTVVRRNCRRSIMTADPTTELRP
jgi:hypothetical protein